MLGVTYVNLLSTGWIISTALILVLGGYVGVRDRRAKKWRDLYDLADTERKEVQGQLNARLLDLEDRDELIQKQKDIIVKLDALQMPVRIVELMDSSVRRIDDHARARLDQVLHEFSESIAKVEGRIAEHERQASERHQVEIRLFSALIERLNGRQDGHGEGEG